MTKSKNIVDIFESTLETKFEPRYISDDVVTNVALCKLANELAKFYEEYQFMEKIPGELTPFLPPRLGISHELFDAYMHNKWNGFNMLPFVKRHLLYSHRIYIYDTLMPLLDYIRIDPSYRYEEGRKNNIIRLVKDYAAIAPLLQRNIVIPTCLDAVRPRFNECMLSNDEDRSIKRLSKTESYGDFISVVANSIKEQGCYRGAISKVNFDFYFPSKIHVAVFRALMQCQHTHFCSNQIKEPFRVGTIANLNSLNVDNIKLNDIINIRFLEDAFAEFRAVLHEILRDIETNEGDFSDVDTEFSAIAKERCRRELFKLSEAAKKSSPLTALLDSKDKIALGIVLGLYTGDPLAGAIVGAVKPLYDILRSTSHSKGREISSLRCHYLALSSSGS